MSESKHQCLDDDLSDPSQHGRSQFGGASPHYYIPKSRVTELLTPCRIREELEYQSSDIDDGIVDYIDTSAKLLFCITLSTRLCRQGLYEAMRTFHQGQLLDSDLPISGNKYPELLIKGSNQIDLTKHDLFKTEPWRTNARARWDFVTNQWKYLAPVFASGSSSSVTMNLEESHILPIEEVGSIRKSGTFGNVYQIFIHESHQETPLRKANGDLATHAIKELKASLHKDASKEDKQLQKDWELEKKALQAVTDVGHEHMIQVQAIINKDQGQYFLFPWADKGSLQDYYEEIKRPEITDDLIRGILKQLTGLADAICKLHNFNGNPGKNMESSESYRHGDLKPENILIFSDGTNPLVGKWKIADMGLAKHHFIATGRRDGVTSTRYGTRMYEPPEVVTRPDAARSRLYDIWSMGCIVLEMLVWLLYGYDELGKFNKSLKGSPLEVESPYWEKSDDKARVHHKVRGFMRLIREDLESGKHQPNALGDLLKVVETKLLVVDLPGASENDTPPTVSIPNAPSDNTSEPPSTLSTPNLPQPSHVRQPETPTVTFTGPGDEPSMHDSRYSHGNLQSFRCNAESFLAEMRAILGKYNKNEAYWKPGQTRNAIRVLHNMSLSPNETPGSRIVPKLDDLLGQQTGTMDNELYISKSQQLSKKWEMPVDNVYAQKAFDGLPDLPQEFRSLSSDEEVARLCEKCQNMELWKPNFQVTETMTELENMSGTCDFCRMRWEKCKNQVSTQSTVHFSKVDSALRLNERYPPILALCRPLGFGQVDQVPSIQLGLPRLPAAGSALHVAMIRHWLDYCDQKHSECRQFGNQGSLPTRLIYVGRRDLTVPVLKLIETKDLGRMVQYLALSHPWGHAPHFCTYPNNLERHKQGIEEADLPATFRDAVEITRKLDHSYLWIDSICIEQGPDGDFRQESKRMEDVFSQAYCVLAASSALGQRSGFSGEKDDDPRRLGESRRQGESRQALSLSLNGGNSLYVCDSIDNFNSDVLESGLNQRGWVLQERALARRTIHFTKSQTYFECGEGIRCETFTKMTNKLASFLGDPVFPKIAFQSTRGGKILLCQDLYKQYSRLNFSEQQDRPDAIAGLENRLIKTLNVHGGFGIFDDPKHLGVLRRSLLWHRAVAEYHTLEAINFTARTCPPTWSWMMYKGGIDYLGELPFDEVEWNRDDVLSPWENVQARWHSSDGASSSLGLSVRDRNFTWRTPEATEDAVMILDIPPRTHGPDPSMKCVVLGKLRDPPSQAHDIKHFVLFVTDNKQHTAGRRRVLKRLGAGYLPGRWINFDEPASLAELH